MAVIVRGSYAGTGWPRVTRTVVTPAALTVFTLAEAKAQSRIDLSDEDSLLTDYLAVATKKVETDTGTALLTQTVDITFDGFPQSYDSIELPIAPVQSVSSVSYIDGDGVTQTIDSADRLLSGNRLALIDTEVWPADLRGFAPVTVRVVAGYTAASLIPADLRHAVRLVFGWLAAHREPEKFEQEAYEMFVGPHRRVLVG